MAATEPRRATADPPNAGTAAQRALARAAFLLVAAAVVVLIAAAGFGSIGLLVLIVVACAVVVAAGYWFLTNRGVLRWIALAVAVLTPVVVVVVFIAAGLLLEALIAAGLWILAVLAGAAALARDTRKVTPTEHEVPPPTRPFFIMNPHSGGGKVAKFGLADRARALGAEVALLEGPGTVDVAALAEDAVERGADLLGVAGGDGTQALVAGIAAHHGLPFVVISAGTRNHFALDLGLDREDPARCLDALTDGVELRIDLGLINGRTFVNNASFGAYADVVQRPEYRAHKSKTALELLPDLMMQRTGARLSVQAGDVSIDTPQAVLISNNPYGANDLTELGRRPRLDLGTLGVIGVSVRSTRQAVSLLHRASQHGLTRATGAEVVVQADTPTVPVGVDGEALTMDVPVRCTSVAAALRVRVPRHRPGVPAPHPRLDWVRLRQLALAGKGT